MASDAIVPSYTVQKIRETNVKWSVLVCIEVFTYQKIPKNMPLYNESWASEHASESKPAAVTIANFHFEAPNRSAKVSALQYPRTIRIQLEEIELDFNRLLR